jgi:hypothetical protein
MRFVQRDAMVTKAAPTSFSCARRNKLITTRSTSPFISTHSFFLPRTLAAFMIIHDASSASKKHLRNFIQPIMQLSVFFVPQGAAFLYTHTHTHVNCTSARSTQCNLFMVAATIKLIPRGDAFSVQRIFTYKSCLSVA